MNNKLTAEIRFECDQELKSLSLRLHKEIADDLKLSSFNRKIFLLGIQNITSQLAKGEKNKEILIGLLK